MAAAGPLGSPFAVHRKPALTEDQTPPKPAPSFKPTQSPEKFSNQPEVQIPVTQEDPENTKTPKYNSGTTPVEPPIAESETTEEMAETDTATERAWNPPSETSDDEEFFSRNDIMKPVLTLGTQMTGIAKAVSDLQNQNAQQSAGIFELRSQVQQLTLELKKRPTAYANPPPPPPHQQQQQQQKATGPNNQMIPGNQGNANPKGKGKSYANVAATGPAHDAGAFTKVTRKKKTIAKPFFQPQNTRLNRQLIVETEGPLPELITNDDILKYVNARREPQGLSFGGV